MADDLIPGPTSTHGGGAPSRYRNVDLMLLLVLQYLRLPDLLTFRLVSRFFRDAISSDASLWRDLAVVFPLSERVTDESLIWLASKANGKLESLTLVNCFGVTDDGLMQVVDGNLSISKLRVPGCSCLTADGIVKIVKHLFQHKGKLKHLQIRGIWNITTYHHDILKSFLCKRNTPQLSSYSYCDLIKFNCNDRPMDLDICPKCKNVRLVFDCTRKECRSKKSSLMECRGCFFCITRCEDCGGCTNLDEFSDFGWFVCRQCWESGH